MKRENGHFLSFIHPINEYIRNHIKTQKDKKNRKPIGVVYQDFGCLNSVFRFNKCSSTYS